MTFPRHFHIVLGLVALLGLLPAAARPAGHPQGRPETFTVDSGHSSVIFKIRHLDVSSLFGRFNSVRGGFTWDDGDPANGSMRILIDAGSVDSNRTSRDERFRGEAFLHSEEFSTISFTSKAIKHLHHQTYHITGDLTLRGVRRAVTAELEWLGARDTGQYGYRGGFEAELNLRRSDFGMSDASGPVEFGDEVTVMIGVEGTRK